MPSFYDFHLQPTTQAVLANMEITEPTPIQAEAIPALLAGNDLVGQSATGSGKTLAYGIPLVERLARDKRVTQALVLVPTRELAIQVHAVLGKLATSRRLSMALLVGGRAYGGQMSALRYGAQIVVGTPGRIKDHLDRGSLELSHLRICVLDEADQMLDIGFAPAVEEILSTTPDTRQTALFSATMPAWVATLEQKFLKSPVKIDINLASGAPDTIEQIAYQVPHKQKMAALCTLLQSTQGESSLIFGKTKFGVEKLGKQLSGLGFTVGTLHGNKSQRAREEVLTAFRRGQVQALLATNVAARGLDIQDIYQVINYELPESSDLFTHRIGRTGRMGRQGKAITLLVPSDIPKWRRMARNLGQTVTLQQLTLDEEPDVTMPPTGPEVPVTQVYERSSEPQPIRDRERFSPRQKPDRIAQPRPDSRFPADFPRRHKERLSSENSWVDSPRRHSERQSYESASWQSEDYTLPERSYSRKTRNVTRGAEKQSVPARSSGKRSTHSYTTAAPQRPAARRKSRSATPVAQTRWKTPSKRSASRWR